MSKSVKSAAKRPTVKALEAKVAEYEALYQRYAPQYLSRLEKLEEVANSACEYVARLEEVEKVVAQAKKLAKEYKVAV